MADTCPRSRAKDDVLDEEVQARSVLVVAVGGAIGVFKLGQARNELQIFLNIYVHHIENFCPFEIVPQQLTVVRPRCHRLVAVFEHKSDSFPPLVAVVVLRADLMVAPGQTGPSQHRNRGNAAADASIITCCLAPEGPHVCCSRTLEDPNLLTQKRDLDPPTT